VPEARLAAEPTRLRLVAAFTAIYLIWGSVYLAIRFTIETLPPFFTNGVRLVLAGVILYLWARLSGTPPPSRREWVAGSIVGALMFLAGTGAVVWAERFIPSGIAALVIATEPISFVLIDSVRRRVVPRGSILAGLALGLIGIGILVGPGELLGAGRFDLAACAVLVVGTFAWAAGSLFSRDARMVSSPVMATAVTLVAGGLLLALLGLAAGEIAGFDPAAVSSRSLLATTYLLIFGSLIGFSAYLWLLRVATPSRVATYAYVNPIVAVLLGWTLASEPLTPRVFLAAVVIVGAVVLIIRHGGEDKETAPSGEGSLACAPAPEAPGA
jgi:drug/metabolite transporter (DMT)-like permease